MRQKYETQFNRASISLRDFEEASEYLSQWEQIKGDIQRKALLTASIVAYSRPFIKSQGKEATSKLPDNNARLEEKEKTLHKKIINLRNNAVAHSDYDSKAVRRISGNSSSFLCGARLFNVLSENISIPEFVQLCAKQIDYCRSKQSQLNLQIYNLENGR